ncbi:MAG: carboxypeptidase-like regulatory domain-containing protein [Bacteroidota bacterium]|nr:carboxypeptidase-like regulatory domain-containing protein [Bacteroidota bacterium]
MPVFFRFSGRLLVAVALLAASSACSKTEAAYPPPTTGGIEGAFEPADALTAVTATRAGSSPVVVTPGAGGTYSFSGLVPGSYDLTYTPAQGYRVPPARPVDVPVGGATGVPLVSLVAGSFTFGSASSTTFTADNITARLAADVLTLQAGNSVADVSVQATGVTGPGSFTITSGTFNEGNNRYRMGGYYALNAFRVTSLNPTTHRVSGTFSFNADPYAGSGFTTGIFGTFTDIRLQ